MSGLLTFSRSPPRHEQRATGSRKNVRPHERSFQSTQFRLRVSICEQRIQRVSFGWIDGQPLCRYHRFRGPCAVSG